MLIACLFVAAYLLGAIPFGVLITRAHGVDITKIGSGNIGATNVARAVGRWWATAVFLLDVLKGFAPTFLARYVDGREWVWYVVGVAAIAGHCASPFLRFKGGKGIATSLGMVFGASPIVAGGGFGVFLLFFFTTRYVSLSSIIAVGTSVLIATTVRDWVYVGIGSLLFFFVLYTHRANISRLRNGTEPKFNLKKNRPSDQPHEDDEDGGAMASATRLPPAPRSGDAENPTPEHP